MEEVIYVELCLRADLNERWLYGDINSPKADEHYRNHVVNNKDDYDYFIRHNDPRFLISAPAGYSKEQAEEYCKKEYLRRAESLADSDAVNYDSVEKFNKPVIGFKSEEKSDDRYIKIKSYLSQNGLSTAQELVVYCRDKVTGEPLIISYMLCNRNKADSFITRAHSDLPEEEQHVNNRYGEVEFVNQFNEDEVKQFPSFSEAKRFFDSNPNCFSCKEIKWGKPVEGRELHRDKNKATASALNMSVISNIVELSDSRFSEGDARDFIKLFGVDLIKSLGTDKLQQYISEYIELSSDDSLSPEDIKSLVLNESHHIKITEALLTEANRQQLLQKSRKGRSYAPSNQYNGRNRFERRMKSSISATVRDYNMIQMDPLFKRDILEFKIPVMGETDVYVVDVRVDGLLAEIRKQLMANKGILEFKVVLQSLMKVLNIGDVYIGCNCLHPDTKIKLLDGTTPTVKEMCERFDAGEALWVYSTDEHGDFKPGQVERVWKTGDCTDFIKITLDNGEEIITTPEHPYMLRDGTYAFACDLKEGQSLMPMYFNYHNDYEQVKLNTETRGWRSIYKLVAEALKSEEIQEALARVNPDDNMTYDIAIHHKDFNKHNNNPDNLEIMTAREHWDYHASLTWENKPEEMKQHIIETSRKNAIKRNANPTDNMIKSRKEWQEKGRLRNYDEDRKQQQSAIAKQHLVSNRCKLTFEELSKYSKEAWERGCFNTKKFHEARVREGTRLLSNKDNQLRMRKAKMLKVLQQMLDSGVELTEENYNKYRLKTKASKAEDVFGSFNNMISEFQLNHKVIKVEKMVLESTPVYDIKVKEWENFVVDAGVVLHNCPDARYRQAYWQTSNDYKAGYKERRPSNITNPHDDLGAGCKHVLLILANLDWAVKVASVINNYIKYCKEHLQRNYADYIFPKIYGMKYDKAVQLNLFDNGLFPEDQKTMKAVIDQGFRGKDEKGKFAKGNEYRFQKKEPEPEEPEEENPLDLKFHNEEEPEEETPEEES